MDEKTSPASLLKFQKERLEYLCLQSADVVYAFFKSSHSVLTTFVRNFIMGLSVF